ncbi:MULTISPECIES: type III secretion system translocator chaperone SicA [Pandoraea]|uniref:type III secretion system translocator chaperone SicA n=1 Tax=Pandoraea TaxID=93217 RepID=UPI002413F6D0|nr:MULTISPECIES: type III secretion system translocator chaperone SicA [Pandoraea]
MVHRDMRDLWRSHDVGALTYRSETHEHSEVPATACLRTMAREAFVGLREKLRADGTVLPAEHELFPDAALAGVSTVIPPGRLAHASICADEVSIRASLSDAARRAVAAHGRARTAFGRSQERAMQADLVVAEIQLVLDILSPRDPQYARASQKRHVALAEAREAAAQADDDYRWIRATVVEPWILFLAALPACTHAASAVVSHAPSAVSQEASTARLPNARSGRAGHGVHGGYVGHGSESGQSGRREPRAFWGRSSAGRRRGPVSRLAFIPVTRLADRRLTRFRVSEGGNSMTQAAMQTDTDEGRVTSAIWNAVVAGASLKDIHGIPSETMDGLYAHAYDFYSNGQLTQAEAFFRFLCIYDFYNPEYIVGLAAVCQLKEEYQKAVDLYAMAFAVGKNDYRPVFYAGQCQMMMRNRALARECFGLVCESSCDADLRTKAKAYLDAIGAEAEEKTPGDKEAA